MVLRHFFVSSHRNHAIALNKYNYEGPISQAFWESRPAAILDYHRLYHPRLVLSRNRTPCHHLHDRPRDDEHLERSLVVRTRMSTRKSIRPLVVEIFTPSPNTQVRALLRVPSVHGFLYLRHVRLPTDFHRSLEWGRLSNVEWYRSCVLDDYRDDHHCRCHAEFYLCATHLVFVLSHGNDLPLGCPEEGSIAQGFYEYPCVERMSDEVQDVCPCLSNATYALR